MSPEQFKEASEYIKSIANIMPVVKEINGDLVVDHFSMKKALPTIKFPFYVSHELRFIMMHINNEMIKNIRCYPSVGDTDNPVNVQFDDCQIINVTASVKSAHVSFKNSVLDNLNIIGDKSIDYGNFTLCVIRSLKGINKECYSITFDKCTVNDLEYLPESLMELKIIGMQSVPFHILKIFTCEHLQYFTLGTGDSSLGVLHDIEEIWNNDGTIYDAAAVLIERDYEECAKL